MPFFEFDTLVKKTTMMQQQKEEFDKNSAKAELLEIMEIMHENPKFSLIFGKSLYKAENWDSYKGAENWDS